MKGDVCVLFGAFLVLCGFQNGNAVQNLAVGKSAYQSDIGWNGLPAYAVDGNSATQYYYDNGVTMPQCAHTKTTQNAWWEVDLGRTYRIDHVKVFGRTDCCDFRLKEVQLYIGNGNSEDDYVLSGYHAEILPVPYTFQVTPQVYGRWVRISHSSNVSTDDFLCLCEVEVMGDEISAAFEKEAGKLGTGVPLKSSQARTKTECCAQCKITDKCSAVNYNSVTQLCELLETVSTITDYDASNHFYRLR